jgi:hypothetical protein
MSEALQLVWNALMSYDRNRISELMLRPPRPPKVEE